MITAIILSLLSSNVISNSIRRIIVGIDEIADGDLSTRITLFDKKELGMISNRFNVMADKLQYTEKKLIEAKDLQNRFFYTMSHDLRSPLGIMLSMIDLTLKNKDIGKHSKMHLRSGYAAGRQLQQLVEDVLDIGKIEAGRRL